MEDKLAKVFEQIDKNTDKLIQRLAEAVSIKSVSAWPHTRPDCVKMVHWMKANLESLEVKTEIVPIEMKQTLPDGKEIDIPPLLFARIGSDKSKKTLLIYGHIDVQPAIKTDGWDTDPFTLTEIDGKYFGRGATDDKGPVLAWLNVIEAYRETGNDLPVNIKFVFECMEESGSIGLDDTLKQNLDFFNDVDFVCISDNYWLTPTKPCVTYGLRGMAYFFVTVECAHRDLHSGIYGGAVHEAMWDLVYLLNTLVTADGKILIEGIQDQVVPLTDEEAKLYENIEFSPESFCKNEVGTTRLLHADKAKLLQHRWRYPSLSIHGIEGDFSEAGAKTVIPRKVTGKFSVRLVPNMQPDVVEALVKKHLEKMFAQRNSPNKLTVSLCHAAPAWLADYKHPNYEAGRRAVRRVWGVEPDLTREGVSIPVALTFEELTGKSVLLLPIGQSDDGAHSNNEKIAKKNYISGAKVLAGYLEEVAA